MPPGARLLLLTGLIAVLTACGAGGGAGADGDPASIVPAQAGLYFEAQVRPEGDRRKDALAAAGKLLRTPDPEPRLRELLDEATKDSGEDFDYDRDVAPWLGERAGVFVGDLAADEPNGLVVAATTDEDKARDAIEGALRRSPSGGRMRERSYAGIDYRVGADGTAVGIVDGFLVAGDEQELKRSVKAAESRSLADSNRYQDTLDGLSKERLATGYLDAKELAGAAARADPASAAQLDQVTARLELEKVAPVGLAFLADGDRLAVDAVQSLKGAGRLYRQLAGLASGASAPLTGELPGDAWAAYGVPKLGRSARVIYEELAGGLGGAAISEQLRQQLGLDLDEDVFRWIGDTAVFVRGTSTDTLEGAVVIQATDPAKARRAVAKLVGVATQRQPSLGLTPTAFPGAELAFTARTGTPGRQGYLAVGNGRVVLGVGERATRDGLRTRGDTLADTEGFKRARRLGGAEPSFFVSMPAVLGLADGSGAATDPDYAKAKPYLETISALAAGAEREGERLVSRFTVAFKE